MYQITLYVLGISCLENYQVVEKEIKGLCGIISCKGSLPKGKIVIEFKPGDVNAKEIINRLERQGLSVWKKVQREFCYQVFN
ncbi:hypothetical protein [Niallia sp. Krafla_26]|uniref:hypothetical protein n=1 Tax=Niallia sp. Krafla_26 TaxID=3064703 RepID=UPI003D177B23